MTTEIQLTTATGKTTISLDGNRGNIDLGGEGTQGDVTLKNPIGQDTVHIDGGEGTITLNGKQVVTMDVVEGLLKKIAELEARLG